MPIVSALIPWLLFIFLGVSAQSVAGTATVKTETLRQRFAYGQAQDIGLWGSSNTTWYRATQAASQEESPNPLNQVGTTLLCLSSGSSEYGRCATNASPGVFGGEMDIPLDFKEERSAVVVTLNLHAVKSQSFSSPQCQSQHPELLMDIAALGANKDLCEKRPRDVTGFKVYLPASQINKLPVGGKWTASFRAHLNTRNGENYWHQSDLLIEIDDSERSDVYFPQFSTSTPQVKLDFTRTATPSGTFLSAQRKIDICLYDGFNLYSNGFKVSFKGSDENAFNLLLMTGKHQSSDRINLKLQYAVNSNTWQTVAPLEIITVDTSGAYSTINLPGLSVPVICKNTTLNITVPPFKQSEKSAGLYKGTITLVMMSQ